MHVDSLIKMANQIGAFFDAMPDRAEALDGIAQHIKRFWEPRMRRDLLAFIDAGDTGDISATVLEAVRTHRAMLEPAAAAARS